MRQIILSFLIITSFLYGLEVPEPRKAFVFAPCRFTLNNGGEDEMKNLFDHEGHNYHNYRLDSKVNSHSDLDPEDATLSEFTKALSSPYGVFFVHSHAGSVSLLVETYPYTDDGERRRNEKFEEYIATGYSPTEIYTTYDHQKNPTYYGIAVKRSFIQTRACHKDKSIVFIAGCRSFPLANAFNARNFLGFAGTSTVDKNREAAENLFYNIGGLRDDVDGEKNNDTIHYVYAYANSVNSNLGAQLNGPTMRLYLAPKILKVEVNREVGIDKEEIYTYKYPDLTYPFIDSSYPGDLSGCQKKPANAGRLRVKIRFSEGMDTGLFGQPTKVYLKPAGSEDPIEVKHEFWLKTLYDNDTWDGYIDIPSNQGDKWDGLATLMVKGLDHFNEDDSSKNPEGELDTDGDGIYNGHDTWHKFYIDTTNPEVKSTNPADGEENVPLDKIVSINIEDPEVNNYASGIDSNSFDKTKCRISPPVSGNWFVFVDGSICFEPEQFKPMTEYSVAIQKGAIKDKAGNPLEYYSFTFKTKAGFIVQIDPTYHSFKPNQTKSHKITIENKTKKEYKANLSLDCIESSGCLYISKYPETQLTLPAGGKKETTMEVTSRGELAKDDDLVHKISVSISGILEEAIEYPEGKKITDHPIYIPPPDTTPPNVWLTETNIKNAEIVNKYDCKDKFIGSSTNKGNASFSWAGSDNVTLPSNLSYSYSLGKKSEVFSNNPSASYNLDEGDYTFYLKARDEAGNESNITYSFKIETKSKTVKSPGCDHPDETMDVSTIHYDKVEVDFNSKILILNNGFSMAVCDMLKDIGETFNLRDPSGELSLFTKYPILLIPTGGLDGLNTQSFKEKLKDYAKGGGTIICFAQQYGEDFQILPGNLSAYGWREDQSCYSNAVYIQNYHPIISSQQKQGMDASVDGYFTKWPDNATIILARTKNGLPAMLIYPYGKGSIIVGTLYSDWGYKRNQVSKEENLMINNLITFAKSQKEIPEIKPGETLTYTLSIPNTATLRVYSPDKELLGEYPYFQTFTYYAKEKSKLGIYKVTDQGNDPIFYFAVSKHLSQTNPLPGLLFSLTSPTDILLEGEKYTFSIYIANNTQETKTITTYWEWVHGGKNYIGNFTIPSKESLIIPFITTATRWYGFGGWRLWIYFYEGERYLGVRSIGGKLICLSLDAEIEKDREQYTLGDVATITVKVKNKISQEYNLKLNLKISHPNNTLLFQEERDILLGTESIQEFGFTIPSTATSGYYIICADVSKNNERIGYSANYFKILKAFLSLKLEPSETFIKGTNTIFFTIANKGSNTAFSPKLVISLNCPDNNEIKKTITLSNIEPNETRTISSEIYIPKILFGTYRLNYTIEDEEGGILLSGKSEIPSSIIINPKFDKPFYRIRDRMNIGVEVINNGSFRLEDFLLSLSIPDIGFEIQTSIGLAPKAKVYLVYNPIIPEGVKPGIYPIEIRGIKEDSTITKTISFVIPKAKLVIKPLEKERYATGETLTVIVENQGGVDSPYEFEASLCNWNFKGTGTCLSGGTSTIAIFVPFWPSDRSMFNLEIKGWAKISQWILIDKMNLYLTKDEPVFGGDEINICIESKAIKDLEFNYNIFLIKDKETLGTKTGTATSKSLSLSSIPFIIPNRLKIEKGTYTIRADFREKERGLTLSLDEKISISGMVEVGLNKMDFTRGEDIGIIFNNRGNEKNVNLSLRLMDNDNLIASSSSSLIIPKGSSTQIFNIPDYVKTLGYKLIIELKDDFSDILSFNFDINIKGIETDLDISLDKIAYFPDEPIKATISLTNKSFELKEATISTRVIDMNPPKIVSIKGRWNKSGEATIYLEILFSHKIDHASLYPNWIRLLFIQFSTPEGSTPKPPEWRTLSSPMVKNNLIFGYINVPSYYYTQYFYLSEIIISANIKDVYGNSLDGNRNGVEEGSAIDDWKTTGFILQWCGPEEFQLDVSPSELPQLFTNLYKQ
ncbi:MAG: Ig-like domain-containing protein [bacterium]